MRGIDTNGGMAGGGEAGIGRALRAMAMHHVRVDLSDKARDMAHRRGITKADLPAHGNACHAQRHPVGQVGQLFNGLGATRPAIGHNADLMAARGLAFDQVDDMAKKPANGRTKDMQDFEGFVHDGDMDVKSLEAAPDTITCGR